MSASENIRPVWLDQKFWERLDRIESDHQRIQSDHETLRRGLDKTRAESSDLELETAWRRYCEVIADLDRTTSEIEALRTGL